MEELTLHNSFFAFIDYEGDMCASCRILNVVTLNHLKRIINSELLCNNGREVKNVFYRKSMLSTGEPYQVVCVSSNEDVNNMISWNS